MAIAGRMTKFRITELSGCTKPAQEGAKAVFMKRDDTDDAPAPVGPGPHLGLDWDVVKTHTLELLRKGAEDLARQMGCSYEKAYADLLERCPRAAAAIR